MRHLGAEAVFVGSGIFKSSDPDRRARAIVRAATHYEDAKAVLDTLASWREVAERHEEQPREFLIELLATAEKAGDGGA